ncbi:protein LYK2 [Salvia miltiorrhiza]|uniref:protein LYK2 n=1 Tax=Salvia miltiorrhiza TaxID=226208 RepID=UPI0025AC827D|nr:protein LYK2 [Salvia miltiorrhiza]
MWMTADYVGIAAAGILLITAIIATILFLMKNMTRRENSMKQEADSELQRLSLSFRTATDNKVSFDGSHDDPTPHAHAQNYKFEHLQKATQYFSSSNLISGAVYRGRLDGEDVAIRRLPTHVVSRIEFHLAQQSIIEHPNIIRVLGTCTPDANAPDSFLVIEYASNGSLRDWIHGGLAIKNQFIASCDRLLNWNQRLKICADAANAMHFLHDAVNLFHIRLNVGNIFLDHEFNAKICVSLESKNDREEGWLAPEYVRERVVSPSVDVFAFGVVLLEVMSGRPPASGKLYDEIEMVESGEECLRGWMDGRMGEGYSIDAAVEVVKLARCCVEEEAAARPGAGEIAAKLLNVVEEG